MWLELRMAGGSATGQLNASPHPPIFDLHAHRALSAEQERLKLHER